MSIENMKTLLCGLLLMMVGTVACKKTEHTDKIEVRTLATYLKGEKDAQLFSTALQLSGLDTVFSSGGPYTLFVPADSAFINAGFTAEKLRSLDKKTLGGMIGYLILPGRIGKSSQVGFMSDTLTSLHPRYKPVVTQNYYGAFFNGVKVTEGNISLADGVVHKTGRLPLPPAGTLMETMDAAPDLKMVSYIFHRVKMLELYASNPVAIYKMLYGNTYTTATLVMPTDAAFKTIGYNVPSDLAGVDTLTLIKLVRYGCIYGTNFTCDFIGGRWAGGAGVPMKPGTVALNGFGMSGSGVTIVFRSYDIGKDATFEIGKDGVSFYGAGVITPPHIIRPDIVATNGVIHVLDQLFAPQGDYVYYK
ncbi:fasciclin domain-containing protein [Chitinophaga sp. 212800010-3]|uniref:fasciclin domain-containing protein n=1 Tax=unclassified Chitinophaga TaxID=2619133 RepID=UPI002DEC918B|nr:hypothetical protein [Chitinophaga sp. 212800010-3]